MMSYLAIAVGGALGGGLRYAVGGLIDRRHAGHFPWGTLSVNVSGALVAGVLAAALGRLGLLDSTAAAALLVGICGSYTTVSSFSLQALTLARAGHPRRLTIYLLGSVAGCLLAVALGYRLGLGVLPGGLGS